MFKLIVGLGNPGEKFLDTRHNLGFEVIDALARKLENSVEGLAFGWQNNEKFKSLILKNNYTLDANHYTLVLAKPLTFMNKSGLAVATLARFFKVQPADIIVIHDDLDLLLGHMKVRMGGSDAGHHGLESIINSLGSEKFVRLKLGIGVEKTLAGEHKQVTFQAETFVMQPFLGGERSKVKAITKRAIKAVEVILTKGVDKAQNQFN